MRKSIIVFAVLAASGLMAESAWALKTTFQATVAEVRAGCSKAGGTFGVHPDGRGYGCTKKNCDGQGGDCHVECDNNNTCTGVTPSRTRPGHSLVDVITGSRGATTSAGDASGMPSKSGGLLGDGLLGGSGGFATTGPSATGSPIVSGGTTAPPPAPSPGAGTIR
jgi:hypothetical protein